MITLTPFERTLRRTLVDRVQSTVSSRKDPCITYADLGAAVDPQHASKFPMTRPPFRGLPEALGHVTMYEVEHGRPMLTALVVQAESGMPGSGFVDLARHLGVDVKDDRAFWQQELAALLDFWRDADPTRVFDAALERVMEELQALKRRLK